MKITETKIQNNNVQMTQELVGIIQELNGQDVLIEFSKLPMKRSHAQNRYYQAIVVPHFQKLFSIKHPVNDDMTRIMLKQMFLMVEIIDFESGEIVESHRDTSELNTKEFSQFLDSCRAYYQYELGEELPLPRVLNYKDDK